jgi:L-serine dehydratase
MPNQHGAEQPPMEPQRTAAEIGVLEIFKIGIGPSSSHTMGPLQAARQFMQHATAGVVPGTYRLEVELFGSLAATGRGHRTDEALAAGLLGLDPAETELEIIWGANERLRQTKQFACGALAIRYDPDQDLQWRGFRLENEPLRHPNTMRFALLGLTGERAFEQVARSTGGGFVEFDGETANSGVSNAPNRPGAPLPHLFSTAHELIEHAEQAQLPLERIALENELARGWSEPDLRQRLAAIWYTMDAAIERGLHTEGILPGGLQVPRRAARLFAQAPQAGTDPVRQMQVRLSAFAMAVNEENAAGGRVVTAPTNGAAGLLPAVFRELQIRHSLPDEKLQAGLLVAGVIGALIKTGASISGAEVGCQGEVGAACAMAAGAAVAMLGGTLPQMEAAAEMAIEHHLGMTCDPVRGLVQIPCIERNAMGASMALNAAHLALAGSGSHMVSFDRALAVMKQTGLDMKTKYKETGSGGLGVG